MNLFSWFFGVATATSVIASPLPASFTNTAPESPNTSFGQISSIPPSSFAVLGVSDTVAATALPSITPSPSPTPTPRLTRKSSYSIALLGDSMIDTLGPDAPHLKKRLLALYPGRTFTIYNYGVGGTNIDYGLQRITSSYTYLGNSIPALISRHPDIVVVESFGYNPYSFSNGSIDRHWLQLASIVDVLRRNITGVKIIIASTIAPNSLVFGDGAPGLSFSAQDKRDRTTIIKSYLDSTVKFAKSQHLPLADAFHASEDSNGDGKLVYINAGDHIHYSDAGRSLFAQKVSDAITTNKLLE